MDEALISNTADPTLENKNIVICRTPFYLQICNAVDAPVNKGIGGCAAGCEYFPAFTATDDSLSPFAKHGRFDIHCEAGDIMSFNGTRSAATRSATIKDLNLSTTPA